MQRPHDEQVERLQGTMMSECQREKLESEVESARLNVAEMEREVEAASARNASLEDEIRAMRGETEGYTAKVCVCDTCLHVLLYNRNRFTKSSLIRFGGLTVECCWWVIDI